MVIRSQDKESLINLSNIESIDVVGFEKTKDGYFQDYEKANIWKVTYSGYEKMSYLVEYKNKLKAISVLDMICNNYAENVVKAEKFPELYCMNPIFEMPKDEDVIVYDKNGVIIDGTRQANFC